MSEYSDLILSNDPFCFWRMESPLAGENTTPNNGTQNPSYFAIHTGVYEYPVGSADFSNTCVRFNGIDSALYCSNIDPGEALGNAITLEFWVKPSREIADKTKPEVLFSKGRAVPGSWDCDIFVALTENNQITATLKTTTTEADTTVTADYTFLTNTWYLVHVVFFSNKIEIYKDGYLIKTQAITNSDWGSMFDTTQNFRMGFTEPGDMATYHPFKGEIDEVAIYNKELTATQKLNRLRYSDSKNLTKMSYVNELEKQTSISLFDVDFGLPYMARTYTKLVRNRNPICYWKLGKHTTENLGDSGSVNDAVYNGTPAHYVTGFADICDNSIKLDGVNDFVLTGGLNSSYSLSNSSYEFWISPEELVAGSTEKVIFYKGNYGTTTDICISLIEDNFIKVKVGSTELTSTTALVKDSWAFVALVIDGTKWDLYINGILDSTLTTSTTVSNSTSTKMALGVPVDNAGTAQTDATYTYLTAALDEFALYGYALSSFAIYEHYKSGTNQIILDDSDDVNVSPVYTTATVYSREEFINLLNPVHWWKLDEAHPVPSNLFVDSGSGARDLTYGDPSTNNIVTSPLFNNAGKARSFTGDSAKEAYNSSGLNLGSAGSFTPITISFWYYSGGNSSENDGIMSWGPLSIDGGFGFSHQQTTFRFYLAKSGTNYVYEYANTIQNSRWYFVTITVSSTGKIKFYIDGTQHADLNQTTDGKGLKIPPVSSKFEIGDQGFQDKPNYSIDDVLVFGTDLTASQINQLYNISKFGESYGRRNISSSSASVVSNSYIPCQKHSSFVGELDLTDHILEYSINSSLDDIIDSARFVVSEDFYNSTIFERIQPNSIIKVKERYKSKGGSFDSGWVEIGTFLIDGPAGVDISRDGSKTVSVACSSVTKLMSLDYFTRNIEPDKVSIEKSLLTLVGPVIDTYKFKKYRNGYDASSLEDDSTVFLQNWANSPEPKIYIKDFTNLYSGTDERKLNLDVKPTDEIRLRGGDGGVQLLYGEGALVVDKDFFESSVPEVGLGYPDTDTGISAEFSRYLTYPDLIFNATVGSIDFIDNSKYSVTLSNSGNELYDGWSILLKTGNAKGNFYKLKLKDKNRAGVEYNFTTGANDGTVGTVDWVNPSNVVDSSLTTKATYTHTTFSAGSIPPPETRGNFPYTLTNNGASKYIKITELVGASEIPDSAEVLGLELILLHDEIKYSYKNATQEYIPSFTVKPANVRFVKAGTISTTNIAGTAAAWASFKRITNNTDQSVNQKKTIETVFGSKDYTWGETITGADLKNSATGFVLNLASTLTTTSPTTISGYLAYEAYKQLTLNGYGTLGLYNAKVRVYYKTGNESYYVTDLKGRLVNPHSEEIEVGDSVQIGDCNRLEDAIRKLFLALGFQETDATKPFFIDVQESNSEIILPPLETSLDDQLYPTQILEQIVQYSPPNYNLLRLPNGSIQFKTIVVPTDPLDHELISNYEENKDKSDYNLYTRVIGQGLNLSAVNVALHTDYGGQSAIRAYKKDNFGDSTDSGVNNNNDQPAANVLVKQVLDLSPKTPYITYDGNDLYGVLYQTVGKDVNSWTMEESDLFCIDLGLNTSQEVPQEFEIDDLEFAFINTYREGSLVPQSVYFYTMTEEDYNAEYSRTLPITPSQDDADLTDSYFPAADAKGWKLLTNEITLQEGVTQINSEAFLSKRPQKFRFIKIRVGQPHFRYEVEGKYDGKKFSRINISDFKVWTSNRILASAELGISNNFNGSEYKDLIRRLKRRTYVLEVNPYLNSFEDVKTFSENELLERSYDFTPITISGFAPLVRAGQIVLYREKEEVEYKRYLVRSANQSRLSSGENSSLLILQNFDIKFN